MSEESAKQWSGAALAGLGIIALTVLGVEHVISGEGVGYAIVALSMRAAGLLTHAFGKQLNTDGGK